MLHTVNKSPFTNNSLESCLDCVADGAAVLLIEDGVYGALTGSTVADKVIDGIKLVDYAGFVDLATENDKVQSWL